MHVNVGPAQILQGSMVMEMIVTMMENVGLVIVMNLGGALELVVLERVEPGLRQKFLNGHRLLALRRSTCQLKLLPNVPMKTTILAFILLITMEVISFSPPRNLPRTNGAIITALLIFYLLLLKVVRSLY